jgi:hypothetical protein
MDPTPIQHSDEISPPNPNTLASPPTKLGRGKKSKTADASTPAPSSDAPGPKRGRKPKGSKIVNHTAGVVRPKMVRHNIMLHLKCYTRDLVEVRKGYECPMNTGPGIKYAQFTDADSADGTAPTQSDSEKTPAAHTQNIREKLTELEHQLHINMPCTDRKSACFRCTCDFPGLPIYIIREYTQSKYVGYGCFCSPECAVGHLLSEHIETSVMFERLSYTNHVYGKVFGYSNGIRPSPDPRYVLSKFHGNMSPDEYRNLLTLDKTFVFTDKPMTHLFPELHEDNDEFLLHGKNIPSSATGPPDTQRSIDNMFNVRGV